MSGFLCSMVGVSPAAAVARTAKTVTANGNAQVSTAQSKYGGASALFDGNGDYLTFDSSSADFTFGTNNWTAEMYVRFDDVGANYELFFDMRPFGSASAATVCLYEYNGVLYYYSQGGDRISGGTVVANTWYHVAISRSGNDHKLFLDGTQIGSTYTNTNNITSVNANSVIGGISSNNLGDSTLIFKGYMDEIRLSNSARYTTTFTPSTTAFTNDVNTLLLLHCNGSNTTTVFTDDIGTNLIPRTPNTITARGNAQVSTAQNKFGGASMLSDGAGDCLQVSSNADFGYSTGDFTIEFFIRPTTNLTSTYNIWDQRADGEGVAVKPSIYISGSTLYYYTNNDNRISYGVTLQSGTWYHIALSRSGTSTKLFLDGTQVGSTYTDSNSYTTSQVVIGAYSAGGGTYSGSTPAYFDEIRISNSARYTTTFTPTAAAFTNDRNTLLLLHTDGTNASTTFTDDNGVRSPKGISAVGNAQVDTAQSKFGGASVLFDGTSDGLSVSAGGFNVGTNDITIEFWVRHAAINDQQVYCDFRTGTNNHFIFYMRSDNKLELYDGGSTYTSTVTMATNTWYHLAISRSGTSLKVYRDGTEVMSATNSRSLSDNSSIAIGISYEFFSTNSVNGHMDEFRVSSTARYTAGFTPSTTAFTNDVNTLLLVHCNGVDATTTFTDDNA